MAINRGICPYISRQVADVADSKIAFQPYLEAAGVPTPKTVSLPYTQSGHSTAGVEERLWERGMEPPYVIKAEHGFEGTQVYVADSIDHARPTIDEILRRDGVVIQNRIPDPPELEGRSQYIRVVVHGDEVLGANRTTSTRNFFPRDVGDTRRLEFTNLHAQQEHHEPTAEQQRVAIAAANAIPGGPFVCGVDMSVGDPLVVYEINEGPGLLSQLLLGQNTVARVAEIFYTKIQGHARRGPGARARTGGLGRRQG